MKDRSLNYFLKIIFILLLVETASYAKTNDEYRKYISAAFENTYKQGGFYYEIKSRSVTSNGDTIVVNGKTKACNNKGLIQFTSIYNDSLKVIYTDNQLLYINRNNKTYRKIKAKKKDIEEYVDVYYSPLLNQRFSKAVLNGKTIIKKEIEDNDIVIFKLTLSSSDDIDNIFILINISKKENKITKYSSNISIYNIQVWEEFSLLVLTDLDKDETMDLINEDYAYTISNYTQLTNYRPSDNPDSLQIELNQLTQSLPDYNLISIHGDTLNPRSVVSKFYLVDFWYMSCYPCLKTIPILKSLDTKYGPEELKIISINSLDHNSQRVEEFMKKNLIAYTVYTSTVEEGRKFRGINSYPFIILYDAEFKIMSTFKGYSEDLGEKIEKLIDN